MTGDAASQKVSAWGRLFAGLHAVSRPQRLANVPLALRGGAWPALMVGLRRSYGDVPLNTGGRLIESRHLDRFIAADSNSGVVRVEAGLWSAFIKVVLPEVSL